MSKLSCWVIAKEVLDVSALEGPRLMAAQIELETDGAPKVIWKNSDPTIGAAMDYIFGNHLAIQTMFIDQLDGLLRRLRLEGWNVVNERVADLPDDSHMVYRTTTIELQRE